MCPLACCFQEEHTFIPIRIIGVLRGNLCSVKRHNRNSLFPIKEHSIKEWDDYKISIIMSIWCHISLIKVS